MSLFGMRTPTQLYCLKCRQRRPAERVLFLCPDPQCRAREQPPAQTPAALMGRPVFSVRRYAPRVECPFSPHTAYRKFCPGCGREIPLTTPDRATLAVVGSRTSGKTCYLAGLVHQVNDRLTQEVSLEASHRWIGAGRAYFE